MGLPTYALYINPYTIGEGLSKWSELIRMKDKILIESFTMAMTYPDRAVHISPFTFTHQTIGFNTGFWAGSFSIFPLSLTWEADRNVVGEVEAFIRRINSTGDDVFLIPLGEALGIGLKVFPSEFVRIKYAGVFKELGLFNATNLNTSVVSRSRRDHLAAYDDYIGAYFNFAGRLYQVVSWPGDLIGVSIETRFIFHTVPQWPRKSNVNVSGVTYGNDDTITAGVVEDPFLWARVSGVEPISTIREGAVVGGWEITFVEFTRTS